MPGRFYVSPSLIIRTIFLTTSVQDTYCTKVLISYLDHHMKRIYADVVWQCQLSSVFQLLAVIYIYRGAKVSLHDQESTSLT